MSRLRNGILEEEETVSTKTLHGSSNEKQLTNTTPRYGSRIGKLSVLASTIVISHSCSILQHFIPLPSVIPPGNHKGQRLLCSFKMIKPTFRGTAQGHKWAVGEGVSPSSFVWLHFHSSAKPMALIDHIKALPVVPFISLELKLEPCSESVYHESLFSNTVPELLFFHHSTI